MTDHEAEIVKAAEALARAFGQHGPWEHKHINLLLDAVAAKREAQGPKLMDTSDLVTKYREWRISYNDAASIDRVRTVFLANIITVLGTAFVNASEEFADKRDVNRAAAIVARILGKAS